jgi:hypothetical protein
MACVEYPALPEKMFAAGMVSGVLPGQKALRRS